MTPPLPENLFDQRRIPVGRRLLATKKPAYAQRKAKEKVIVKNRTTMVPSGTIKEETAAGTISLLESVLFIGETKLKDPKSRVFGVKTQVPAKTAHVRRCVAIRRWLERLAG